MPEDTMLINRAPVLTMWAAVVAEALGYERDAALTLGKAVAGLNAQAKGRMLGIYSHPKGPDRGKPLAKVGLGEELWIQLCSRPVPARNTDAGIRAVVKDQPIDPDSVERYLRGKFGEQYTDAWSAMSELAGSMSPEELDGDAYGLYERFRPDIPRGRRGWGAAGELKLDFIRSLAEKK